MPSAATRVPRRTLIALLLASGFAPGAAAQELVPPPRVGLFAMTDSSRYERPELGVMYTYVNPDGTRANAYVYPVPANLLALSPEDRAAREAKGFVELLPAGIEQGWYGKFTVVVDEPRTFESGDGPTPGYLVVAVLQREGSSLVSFMHLLVMRGQYVKARLTLPAEEWRTSKAPNFALDLFRQLPLPPVSGQ